MRVKPRCRQPGETRLGERGAIELEERRGNGMETEGITLLEDDTGKLAPDFDDERLVIVSLLDHGAGNAPTLRREGLTFP